MAAVADPEHEKSRRGPPPTQSATSRPSPARSQGPQDAARTLQRQIGNRAVSLLLTGSRDQRRLTGRVPGPLDRRPLLSVQRHNSWEHTLLGDTPPGQLGQAAVSNEAKRHVLDELCERLRHFQADPRGNYTSLYPNIRWVQLKASALWVTNGELNALGDYLPGPTAYDTLSAEQIIPVLQRMRSGILEKALPEWAQGSWAGYASYMPGMATSWMPGAAEEVSAYDKATADLGVNRYQGLLSRNACHFAPFSWQRWTEYHNEAVTSALLHYQSRQALTPLQAVDTSAEEHQRQALLKNGYADHFLQDSFAAGHLINKTLVMQWFVDYLNSLWWIDSDFPWVGGPDADVLNRMGSAQQPGIAGRDRYGRLPSQMPSSMDREYGTSPTDPQSAQEREDYQSRMSGSGVSGTGEEQAKNYQTYLKFLNSSFLQLAPKAVHDYFNEHGLTVVNGEGTPMRVGGDDTLLSESNEIGARIAARAAEMSRQAIDDLMTTGTTDNTVDKIMALVPQQVIVELPGGGKLAPVSLADFQTEWIKPLCDAVIFHQICAAKKNYVVRWLAPLMVGGGISVDSGGPGPSPAGDYPIPSGDAQTA